MGSKIFQGLETIMHQNQFCSCFFWDQGPQDSGLKWIFVFG